MSYRSRSSAFFPFTSPISLLKYSCRRAMLQLEFGEPKLDESHTVHNGDEKNSFLLGGNTEIDAGSGPAAVGCPVSNPNKKSLEKVLY